MREAELQSAIVEAAAMFGWLHYHTYDSRRSTPGFPDLVLVHPRHRHCIFAELKAEQGRVSTDQQRWLSTLERIETTSTVLWRPHDLDHAIAVLANPHHEV